MDDSSIAGRGYFASLRACLNYLAGLCQEFRQVANNVVTSRQPILTEIFRRLAERVGFAPLLDIENKELNRFSLSHEPLDPHESPCRDTY